MKRILVIIFSGIIMSCPAIVKAQTSPKYEFRGVWVASVVNIDWPSRKGLSVEAQKAEFIKLLDMHQSNGMNAIVMQIRPAGDAFFPSQYEPWSEYLMGRQGEAPVPFYDPLAFMIEETHKRGMEFHAWLNPYRAVFNINTSSVAPNHVSKIHPDWFLVYGSTKYFNPGLKEVRDHVSAIVKDLVTRYDLDGIHMDDYFYPYRIAGKEFPDQRTYERSGSKLSKDDWRRANCDSIIKQVYDVIRSTNPHVKFGISPFGVWRNKSQDPNGSDTRGGQTNYDDLYADVLLWLQKGWIDYVVPQLYWEHGHKLCDYNVLLDWWNKHAYGRQLYIGHALERAGTNAAWRNKNELPNQIKDLREYPTTQGSVFFSSKNFENNPNGWNDSLRRNYYALPALIPPMAWIDSTKPDAPAVIKTADNTFTATAGTNKKIKSFAIFALPPFVDEKFEYMRLVQIIQSKDKTVFTRTKALVPDDNKIYIASVDLNNNISELVELK
ncbi:glycoside hydrolase family 10 protein [Chitinophagaceae bacterium LWZ2-11]